MPVSKKVSNVSKVDSAKQKVEKVAKIEAKGKGLKIDVFDTKGKVIENMSLPEEIFGVKVNKKLIAQAVRVYLANQRRGTVSTKSRGQVTGSTRKIYRQKGTGRARHGGVRAPIFVHGGIAHGPKPRDYALDLPKKMKKQALRSALTASYTDGVFKVVAGLEKVAPKTKEMVAVLNTFVTTKQKKNILVIIQTQVESITRSARNIEGVTLMPVAQLNTYEVLKHKTIVCTKEAISTIASTK